MSRLSFALVSSALVLTLSALPAAAQDCKPDVAWQHEHADAKANTVTTDIEGNRATTIEVCRDKVVADTVKVEVQFAGSQGARVLETGQCTDKLAKWAIIRSHGSKADAGPAKVSGAYRVCKD